MASVYLLLHSAQNTKSYHSEPSETAKVQNLSGDGKLNVVKFAQRREIKI